MRLEDFLADKTSPGQIVEIYRDDEKIGICEIDKDGCHTSLDDYLVTLYDVISSRSEQVQISRNDGQSIYTQTWVRVDVE